ncbi:UDP-N-acetylmuramoyl-tripeptide--D-alanyl-D-alanine ligase [Stenomitos frigidus]|uniref:UDP-N-acetylmuramoyl-tripeptide--D-alanyl-D-alanine ligase n=1 Tax=Stenomitos frigidus ULC18 TaxID=2107698 RepID=A0A2T1EEA1_9CYAN|nr:UDP-N-acetylmuramoyl-tripeptide--D-alanyl-D-alanine ligase [Stenomitos frigidus]PSB31086.1 UDP-N-acetylmuramoyl-tripeptide--D-alanyl-D-alanine ligase [Stenomitos frigidus ULC18]
MSFRATIAQLSKILDVSPSVQTATALEAEAIGLTTDTRSLQAGEVFLALRGDRFDGHGFVEQAAAKGAIAAIVDQRFSLAEWDAKNVSLPLLQVADTLQAYQAIAHWWRNQFTCPVIAVTGSVGKTTTKELIAAVLSLQGTVLKTQANYNNEIGVPKTLLELGAEHSFAVIEMGMRGRGEIALLTQIARPDLGVITNVGTAHIERLGSELAIAQAKCELVAEMPSATLAVLNQDLPLLTETAATVWQGKTMTYGLKGGDLHGQLLDPETLAVGEWTLPLPLPGQHNALNYLAALAVAKALGIDWSPLVHGLTVHLPDGRAKRFVLPNDIVLLDETYNAGLESMLAALQLLAQTPGKRRLAVLGTMKELGERSPEFHYRVGVTARELQLDRLLILADPAEAASMAAGANPLAAECFSSHTAVVERLHALIQPGDRILFKASRAVGLEQVVNQFRDRLSE